MSKIQEHHGMSNHPLYRVRNAMIGRTTNPKDKRYCLYGARGIKVCKEWLDSKTAFFNWALSNGYKKGLSLDRINNNADYCPENCRFVTQKEQNRNTRRNNNITLNGKTMCISDWAKQLGFSHASVLRLRLKRGWTLEKTFSVNSNEKLNRHYFLLNGQKIHLSELCKQIGFNMFNYYARKRRGKKEIKDIFAGVDFEKYKIEENFNEQG